MSSPKDYVLEVSPAPQNPDSGLIKFTVKPRPGPFRYIQLSLASTISVAIVAIIAQEFFSMGGFQGIWSHLNYPESTFVWSLVAQRFQNVQINSTRSLVLLGLILILAVLMCKRQPEDSMLVIRDVGIQLDSVLGWRFTNKSDKSIFIALKDIIDIVINEGFHGYGQVIFYMCILRRSQKDDTEEKPLQIVFPQLLPRKDILLQVWKQSRQVLFGSSRRYWRRVPGQGLRECSMEDLTK